MSFPNFLKPIENIAHSISDYFRKKPTTSDEKGNEEPAPVDEKHVPVNEVPVVNELPTEGTTPPNDDVSANDELSTRVITPKGVVVAKSLDGEAKLLAAEQVVFLDEKATDLHGQTESEVIKARDVNDLSTHIMNASSESKDGSVDCTSKEISQLVERLRNQGMQIPVPSNSIKKQDVTKIVGQLNTIWQEHKDEGQRKAQEFQQCTLERNTLFQFVMSIFQSLQQTITKITSHFSMRKRRRNVMDITAVSQSPYLANAGTAIKSKNPLIEKASRYVSEHPDTDMDKLLLDVFKMLLENEEEAGKLAEKVALREKSIREELSEQMQKQSGSLSQGVKARDFFKKLSDLAFPLALVGEGIASMLMEGAPSPSSVACVAFGGLLVLDVVLDDSIKGGIASGLSRVTGEDKSAWMERISAFVGMASFGLSMVTNGNQAMALVTRVSQLALSCGQAGAEIYSNRQQAGLREHTTEWEISGERLQKWLGHLRDRLASTVSFYELLKVWSDSSKQTLARISA